MSAADKAEVRPGSVEEALANGRALLSRDASVALRQAHAILNLEPANPAALRLAAASHRALRQPAEAAAAERAAIAASERDPALAAAARALAARDYGEASRLAADQLRRVPDDLAALTLSAESALGFGLADKAEPLLRRVLERAPGFAPAQSLLVNALQLQDKYEEALEQLESLLRAHPEDEEALTLKARLLTDLGRHGAAATVYEGLLKRADDDPALWIVYGDALRFLGRKAESGLAYRRALQLDPHHGQAWWSLVNLDQAAIGDSDITRMEQALAARRDQPEHAGNLHFALSGVLEKRGPPERVIAHLADGNRLRRLAQPYNSAELRSQVDRSLALATRTGLPPRTPAPAKPFTPIFIVGMPRSGSTLLERILGLHSKVDAGGELSVIPHLAEMLRRNHPEQALETVIASLSQPQLAEIGRLYIERAAQHRTGRKSFLVDKLHMNWRHLPLILRALPQARVIDIRRSAMDCCWSNYRLLFARGHPAASDLGDLGHFYTDYVRLTDGLRALAPDAIIGVRYEDMLDDLEGQVRQVLDFLGLPFEPGCLDFHLSQAPVATASSEQVRKPLNRDGVGAWKAYGRWLGPLKNALGPLADA